MERTTPVHCLRNILEVEGRYLNLDNITRISLGVNCLTVYSEGCATLSIQKPDGGFTFYETLKKDLRFKFFKGVDGDEFIKKSE
ncbi:MAG: hypothetical protein GY870_14535, partial [archaeon]|nr:hypothetical protein [archaeon]